MWRKYRDAHFYNLNVLLKKCIEWATSIGGRDAGRYKQKVRGVAVVSTPCPASQRRNLPPLTITIFINLSLYFLICLSLILFASGSVGYCVCEAPPLKMLLLFARLSLARFFSLAWRNKPNQYTLDQNSNSPSLHYL